GEVGGREGGGGGRGGGGGPRGGPRPPARPDLQLPRPLRLQAQLAARPLPGLRRQPRAVGRGAPGAPEPPVLPEAVVRVPALMSEPCDRWFRSGPKYFRSKLIRSIAADSPSRLRPSRAE